MIDGLSLAFVPLLPWPAIAAIAIAAVVLVALNLAARLRGGLVRALALAVFVLALCGPILSREEREILPNVVAVVIDRSASQGLGERATQTGAVVEGLRTRLEGLGNTEPRFIEAGRDGDGTALFGPLANAMADVPPDRVGGVILVTDGVVHDIPASAAALGFDAPVHALVTGRPDERDRRIELIEAPRFGIVGGAQVIRFRVIDHGEGLPATATVVVRRDGEILAEVPVVPGAVASVEVEIAHGGPNIVELTAAPSDGELTAANNSAVLPIDGVREKLRVLLVSGEPHAGERTWRNLLKADANVELVHFTILRPPHKQDGTPVNELSLIAFPVRQLFDEKIEEFDLIIFDRYGQTGILPMAYFENIARFVRQGGAVLVASGPDYASEDSIWYTPLAEILPSEPTGGIVEAPFRAALTDPGRRHPVTRDLPGSDRTPPAWSEWYRLIETVPRGGTTLMSGADDRQLLVLQREGEGRVAMLLSDHAWLWARGYQGGGPHLDLLRRLSHWLMQEPELEEEALRAFARGGGLVVERQTMADGVPPVTVTGPTGETRSLTFVEDRPGLWRGVIETPETGLWRVSDGTFTALANVGPPNPREFQDVVSTTGMLAPLTRASGGAAIRVTEISGVTLPRIDLVGGDGPFAGEGWIGLERPEVSVVRGVGVLPLFAGLLGLALLLGALAAVWAREGR